MCLAVPAKILSLNGSYACAETMGIRQKINIQLLDSPVIGDHILIHAGFAIEKIDATDYAFLNQTWSEMTEGIENDDTKSS
ncbi:hypothetical protein SDC9_177856 [bioreactor metagenome]|uniref:Hydrogenase maturation factor HypC n=1 Tax=bioreactor metagenome TaxID=1076179 RepID=A0A645GUD3_9ZZZZ